MEYIPKTWRKVKVDFIPKPGKDSYADAKSLRPISLMSFVLKTLEKLVDRFIRDDILKLNQLCKFQFAYREVKSTEGALHNSVARIEKGFDDKEFMVGGLIGTRCIFKSD